MGKCYAYFTQVIEEDPYAGYINCQKTRCHCKRIPVFETAEEHCLDDILYCEDPKKAVQHTDNGICGTGKDGD